METNSIKVSIIVPVYNVEKYLPECLDSLIAQTLKEIEIICINDGTKDNSLQILELYKIKDNRIKIINQENQGLSATRNNGIKTASGEYIAFVDSDDWVDNDYFEKLYNAAKKYDSDVAIGDFYRQGKILKSKKLKLTTTEFYTDSAQKAKQALVPKYNYVWNKLYRKTFLIKNNFFFPEGKYYEDMYWTIRVLKESNGIVTVPKTFYHYRKVRGSIVTQKSINYQLDRFTAEKDMLDYMKENNIPVLVPYKYGQKERLKIFGVTLFRIEHYYPNTTKFKLFGCVTIAAFEKNYLQKITMEREI